jgi:hypothetical protein
MGLSNKMLNPDLMIVEKDIKGLVLKMWDSRGF